MKHIKQAFREFLVSPALIRNYKAVISISFIWLQYLNQNCMKKLFRYFRVAMHISEWQDISECQCIFRSGKAYFGVAKHISEWQYIFRSGKAYFGVAKHISEWQSIFRSGKAYFGVAKHISEWQSIFRSGKAVFGVAKHISEWQSVCRRQSTMDALNLVTICSISDDKLANSKIFPHFVCTTLVPS